MAMFCMEMVMVEAKEITGGRDTGNNGLRNDWLTYHAKSVDYFSTRLRMTVSPSNSGSYNVSTNPYEGNINGLGDCWYNSLF